MKFWLQMYDLYMRQRIDTKADIWVRCTFISLVYVHSVSVAVSAKQKRFWQAEHAICICNVHFCLILVDLLTVYRRTHVAKVPLQLLLVAIIHASQLLLKVHA